MVFAILMMLKIMIDIDSMHLIVGVQYHPKLDGVRWCVDDQEDDAM